jgi:hypothetical protein
VSAAGDGEPSRCQYGLCSERGQYGGKPAPAVHRLTGYTYCATDYNLVRRLERDDDSPAQTSPAPRPAPQAARLSSVPAPVRPRPAEHAAAAATPVTILSQQPPGDAELDAVLRDVHEMLRRAKAKGMPVTTQSMAGRLTRDLAKMALLVCEGERQIAARAEVHRLERELADARVRAGLNHAGQPRKRRPYDPDAAAKRAENLAKARARQAEERAERQVSA